MTATGRNVILVVLDSARADVFEDNAPNFMSLSHDGTRFRRAIAPAGWTLPSHASLFSGMSPSEHRIIAQGTAGGTEDTLRAAAKLSRKLHREGSFVVPRLQRAGVRTFSTSSSPWLWHASGLAVGFDETDFFYFLRSSPPAHKRHGLPKRVSQIKDAATSTSRYARWVRSGADKGAARIFDRITEFARKGGPFFAFTNIIETHEPHYPPKGTEPALGRLERLMAYRDVVLEPPLLRQLKIRSHNYGIKPLSPAVLNRWMLAYEAETRYVDAWLLRLTERLDDIGLLADTTVIVTSDHGESFGEDGLVGHGISLSEGAGHIPLGMWGGGIERRVVDDPVGLLSIPATLEHLLLGIDDESSLLNESSWGFARMEIENPRAVSRPPRRAKRLPSGPGAAFYDGALKLVQDPFSGPALYDLDDDPREERDLSGHVPPTDRQQAELEAWRTRIAGDD